MEAPIVNYRPVSRKGRASGSIYLPLDWIERNDVLGVRILVDEKDRLIIEPVRRPVLPRGIEEIRRDAESKE